MHPQQEDYKANPFESWLNRNTRFWFWILGLAGGFFQLLAERNNFYNDIIPYLNLAEMYVARGWNAGMNGFWSPLYSWLLAPLFASGMAKPANELFLVHIVNFLIFIAAMAGFDFFVGTFSFEPALEPGNGTRESSVPLVLARAAAYLIFLRLTLHWLTSSTTTPDLTVACFFFLAAAFLVRLHLGKRPLLDSVGLGVTLAFAYFGKFAIFPMACFTFLLLPVIARKVRPRWTLLSAPVVFLCVTAPVLLTLSAKEGKPSFGESGRVAFLMEDNGYPSYFDGEDVGGISEPRGFHRSDTKPAVLVFQDSFPGSYFPSTYPAIWYRGFRPKFDLKNELLILRESLKSVGEMLGSFGEIPMAILALILFCSASGRRKTFAECWYLAVAPVVVTLMYSLVLVESRYLAGFLIVFWVSFLVAAARANSAEAWQARPILYALLIILLAGFAQRTGRQAISALMSHPVKHVQIAGTMASMGLPAGAKIGVVGHSYDLFAVRTGRYPIVAAIPESQEGVYLGGDLVATERVDQAFRQAGAVALLMHSCAPPPQPGWRNLRESDLYLKFLNSPPKGASRQGSEPLNPAQPTAFGIVSDAVPPME